MPGEHYLRRINSFLALAPLAIRLFVAAAGLQPKRKNARR